MEMRAAQNLGLRIGMERLSEDDIPAYDDARESWGQPLRFRSSDGVDVLVEVLDAQNRFNLNRLTLPVTPATVRTPEQMLADLMRMKEIPEANTRAAEWTGAVKELDEELQDPGQMFALAPEDAPLISFLASSIATLPRPESRPMKLNLNSVQPEVLLSVTGPQLAGWVNTVVSQRETAPIPSIGATTAGLPPLVLGALSRVVDVRSETFEIRVTTETDRMQSTLQALVKRTPGGGVEVIRCRW